jgi:hypothetical protein
MIFFLLTAIPNGLKNGLVLQLPEAPINLTAQKTREPLSAIGFFKNACREKHLRHYDCRISTPKTLCLKPQRRSCIKNQEL